MTSDYQYKNAHMSSSPDNWLRFDGDSDEPEWDLDEEADLVDFDSMEDKDEN